MKCDILLVKMRSNENVNDIMIAPVYSYIKEGDIVTNFAGVDYVVCNTIEGFNDIYTSSMHLKNIVEWAMKTKFEDIPKVCGHYSKKEIKEEIKEEENEQL